MVVAAAVLNAVEELQYSHVGTFTCHLFHHFANTTLAETGIYTSLDECCDLFRVWVEEEREHNTPRCLWNKDVSVVLDLISNFHIGSIQSAYHVVERAHVMIISLILQRNDQ